MQPEMMVGVALIGIIAAIALPFLTHYLQQGKIHQCAVRLDAAAADPAGTEAGRTCVVTGAPFTVVDGVICDPSAKDAHHLKEPLCTGSQPLAAKHPMPRKDVAFGVPALGLLVIVVIIKMVFF